MSKDAWMFDLDCSTHVIEKVVRHAEGWEITTELGTCYTTEGLDRDIKEGMKATFFPRGATCIRGIVIEGVPLYYESDADWRARMRDEQAKRDAEKKAAAAAKLTETRARIAKLPEVLRARLKRFEDANPDFWWDYMGYELFVCEQAVLIASTLKSAEAVKDFATARTWERQLELVPGLDDGHSGNTLSSACKMAYWLISDPAVANSMPGSLVVLSGAAAGV